MKNYPFWSACDSGSQGLVCFWHPLLEVGLYYWCIWSKSNLFLEPFVRSRFILLMPTGKVQLCLVQSKIVLCLSRCFLEIRRFDSFVEKSSPKDWMIFVLENSNVFVWMDSFKRISKVLHGWSSCKKTPGFFFLDEFHVMNLQNL